MGKRELFVSGALRKKDSALWAQRENETFSLSGALGLRILSGALGQSHSAFSVFEKQREISLSLGLMHTERERERERE